MTKHYFTTQCPRCGKTDEICCEGHADPPALNCGDCLMNDVELVALTVTPLRRELARNELAMTGAYVRDIKPPLSDYERDEIDTRNMLEMLEDRRKRPLSDYEQDDRESELQIDTFQRLIDERKRQQQQSHPPPKKE
jgi:hypothetical protein